MSRYLHGKGLTMHPHTEALYIIRGALEDAATEDAPDTSDAISAASYAYRVAIDALAKVKVGPPIALRTDRMAPGVRFESMAGQFVQQYLMPSNDGRAIFLNFAFKETYVTIRLILGPDFVIWSRDIDYGDPYPDLKI